MERVPAIRVRSCNQAPILAHRDYVLYWMIASRRLRSNFALDRALEHCRALQKPLLIFEALRCGYRWASDRLHRFVLDGMAEHASSCEGAAVRYYGYVEPAPGRGSQLLEALAEHACVAVTDDYPAFFLPHMVAAAAQQLSVRLEAVDSNGLLPLRATGATGQVFARAFDFRRHLQRELPNHLEDFPEPQPLRKLALPRAVIAKEITRKWPEATHRLLRGAPGELSRLPIDHSVAPVAIRGGEKPARKRLLQFLARGLPRYGGQRNEPDTDPTSGLSPYLHFGHLSVHEIFRELARRENWHPGKLPLEAAGARGGWWKMSASAEQFLDQLITWRELGFNFACCREDYDRYDALPAWARKTLGEHARDEREHVYSLEEFANANTHDELWNAAQRQLLSEGRIHNYLRMLWGKKILEWTPAPRQAAEIMIELNNKYALDGRDPNSYSGIFWVLGRYDRPWGPERHIFGTVRYMSSANTARKLRIAEYLRKYSTRGAEIPRGRPPALRACVKQS